jgi:hypothetical protein
LLPPTWREGESIPAVPKIDAKEMFWNMMNMARSPDPFVYPALQALGRDPRFIVAALSNTIAFPAGIRDDKGNLFLSGVRQSEVERLSAGGTVGGVGNSSTEGSVELGSPEDEGGVGDERSDIRALFDIFISSAHVGMRKPERRIYDLAIQEIQKLGKENGVDIKPEDIVFLDDIGGNLKAAKQVGMRTIKVTLGKSRDAVVELEKVTGCTFLKDEKSKL